MRKKSFVRKVLVLVLIGVSILAFAGCAKKEAAPAAGSSGDDQKTLNIGVLVWKFDDAYGSTVRQAMMKYAQEIGAQQGLKINLDLKDAADSMATQTDQATIMFAAKPDFVIINPAEVAAGMTLVNLAQENNVPFLFYNKEPTPETIQSTVIDTKSIFIGTSPREAGDMQGEILAELYAKDKSIDKNGDGVLNYIMFMGEPNNPEAIARSRYSVETAEKNGLKLQQLGNTLVCNWDQAAAQEAMVATIAQYGTQIEVVFANNDQMALGAVAALNDVGYNTGKPGDPQIVVIGVDAVDSALESIKAGGMTATVKQDGDAMGKANITLAINGALGKPWLEGTSYKLADDGYSVRIPYAKITN